MTYWRLEHSRECWFFCSINVNGVQVAHIIKPK